MQQADPSVQNEALSREFVFTGDPAAMIAARDRIMDFLHHYCADEQEEIDILVALQEGLANAVLHGCHRDPSKVVRCWVEVEPEAITITIKDPGGGFDAAAMIDKPECGVNLSDHGRGISLMRSLMDEVSYRDGGSELHLRRVRVPRA